MAEDRDTARKSASSEPARGAQSRVDDHLVIGIDEFVAARRDPAVHKMQDFATAYGQRLDRESRNH
jgi:hypothetical protein